MQITPQRGKSIDAGLIVLLLFVLIKLLIHLYTNAFASYGIFRDELYYLACSNRLDFGYVDQPPFSIYILALSKIVFGDSVFALRLIPALVGACTVLLTGLIVRKLGGNVVAIVFACLSVLVAPIFLAMNTFYSMNCFDILFWTLVAYFLILVIQEDKSIYWILLGLVLGFGLLNKISVLWLGLGLLAGFLLTSQRKQLSTKWPYIAALIAFVIFLPYIIWNITHDFAHLEFIRNATTRKYASLRPSDFIFGQFFVMNPVTTIVWFAGLHFFFFNKKGKSYNILGIIFFATFVILLINGHSKPEYLSPAYPFLMAAGGVQLAVIVQKKALVWIKYALPIVLIISGIMMAPMALPILPVEKFITYAEQSGFSSQSSEAKELAELPQFFADMFGWENMAKTVSEVYTSLSPEQKAKTVIYAQNYGEAGSIEYFSKKYELPPVVSPHNNYCLWGWEHVDKDYTTVIIIGGNEADHLSSLEEVTQVTTIHCQYCMPYENNLPLFIGRNLMRSLEEIWNSDKNYN